MGENVSIKLEDMTFVNQKETKVKDSETKLAELFFYEMEERQGVAAKNRKQIVRWQDDMKIREGAVWPRRLQRISGRGVVVDGDTYSKCQLRRVIPAPPPPPPAPRPPPPDAITCVYSQAQHMLAVLIHDQSKVIL